MSRDARKSLIEKIEQQRGSKVVSYVTSDRPPTPAQIGDDAVRPLYDHLRRIGSVPKLDVFIYSRGGAIDVPWRLGTAFRSTSEEWAALIPFRANSAATLLCLGADEIVLGTHGELGPIDPIMSLQRAVPGSGTVQEQMSVEDIMSYLKFVQERAGLSDQAALSTGLSKLTERIDAVSLGSAYRTHSHIRDVARRMLLSRKAPGGEQTVSTIVETLAERVYAHGHAIGLTAAKEIGLPVIGADDQLEPLLWELLLEYENDLKLREPLDPASVVAKADKHQEKSTIAIIDSLEASHEFQGTIDIAAQRQLPSTVNINVNLNLQVPQTLTQALQGGVPQLQAAFQQLLQQLKAPVVQIAQQAAQQALRDQAPLVGVQAAFREGIWKLVDG